MTATSPSRPHGATCCGPRRTTRSTVSAARHLDHRRRVLQPVPRRAAASARVPATTAGGFDWCNPEPTTSRPSSARLHRAADRGQGLPAAGGERARRPERDARERPGQPLLRPAARAGVGPAGGDRHAASRPRRATSRGFKTLTLGAAVNFFDPRNPPRTGDAIWNPGADDPGLLDRADRQGRQGGRRRRRLAALRQRAAPDDRLDHRPHPRGAQRIRVPLGDFAAQGVDLASVRKLELRFGGAGQPATGSIQLADVRFQEAVGGPAVYTDKLADIPPIIHLAVEDRLVHLLEVAERELSRQQAVGDVRVVELRAQAAQRVVDDGVVIEGERRQFVDAVPLRLPGRAFGQPTCSYCTSAK